MPEQKYVAKEFGWTTGVEAQERRYKYSEAIPEQLALESWNYLWKENEIERMLEYSCEPR